MNRIISGAMALLLISNIASAQSSSTSREGKPFIHDPSTIVYCDGKYYTFGTGSGALVSEDGWLWNPGGNRPGGGVAPDALKIGDRYLITYSAATGEAEGKMVGGHASSVFTMWTRSLDPDSPDFGFTKPVVVDESFYDDDCDAIDPALLLDPTTGRLWLSYGTYFGFIKIIELDPETGRRVGGNEAVNVAIDCEASAMMYRNGWYYLLGTHGTCCDGANSTYNIVVGRSRSVTGPYLDNMGRDMLKGGGKMVLAAHGRVTGPGHFGHYVVEEGVEKMSCHFEADLNRSGRSVLGIRPLVWVNDWPKAGELFKEGTYEIESERRGYALELAVDFTRMASGMRAFWLNKDEPEVVVEDQKLEEVIDGWPKGEIDVRIGDYMFRPHQKWTVTAVPEAGGYLGAPYYKIVIEGTQRALAAAENAEVVTVPEFTGAPEQLWRIELLTDGTYRIMPKSVPGTDEQLALISVGDSTPALGRFDMSSDNSKWNFMAH